MAQSASEASSGSRWFSRFSNRQRTTSSGAVRRTSTSRASTTTVGALRTAVTVAEAMTNQRLVLNQITALNSTTAGIIDSTSTMLRDQTGKIHEQAAASTIPLETLQRAFQNIYDTMDEVDSFKLRALDSMKQTVTTLSAEVEKSKGYIARAEGQAQAQARVEESALLTIEGR